MKSYILLLLLSFSVGTFAQSEEPEEEKKGFDVERMFAGGSISVGLGGGGFNLGANPQVGYSLTRWLDLGLTTNVNYYSQRYFTFGEDFRQRAWNYGGGPFLRVWPLRFIHLQAQYEYNWISGNVERLATGQRQKFNVSAPSVLVGAGYSSRVAGESFFYTTVLFDITKDENSPYVFTEGNSKIVLPVIRAGFNVYFRKRNR